MSGEMQQVVLARYCDGLPVPEDFRLETRPKPDLREGQFLVRHAFSSVDPGTRSRLSAEASYAPPLDLGRSIDGFSVGTIEASENEKWPVGQTVFCAGGWKTHSIQTGKGFIGKVPDTPLPLSLWIGVLGVPGLTAYFGLKRVGEFKPGAHVLVSSAAGPVGATAGQLAKAWGAERVVGVAGSDTKCAWLKDTAGFDETINYKDVPDLTASIREAMPKGIDVLFDNVGNGMIERCLPQMRMNGRIVVSGQVADYNLDPKDTPGIHSTRPFITHRVRMEGLVVFDDAPNFGEALNEMAGLIGGGKLAYKEERFQGIASMPEAFCGLFRGENFGRRVIQFHEEG